MAVFFGSPGAIGFSASDEPALQTKQLEVGLTMGLDHPENDLHFAWDLHLRAGINSRLEIAFPLGFVIEALRLSPGSSLLIGVGALDFSWPEVQRFFYAPALFATASLRLGPEARLFVSADVMGVETFDSGDPHSLWLRGATGLVLDLGPWLTIAGGVAYQRAIVDNGIPDGAKRTGWVGNARVSLGAVRAHPLYELPTLAVHLSTHIDLIALVRFDVDTDTDTNSGRYLAGIWARW